MATPDKIKSAHDQFSSYFDRRKRMSKMEGVSEDVGLFGDLTYLYIDDVERADDEVISTCNNPTYLTDEKLFLEKQILELEIKKFETYLSDHFNNNSVIKNAGKDLSDLVKKDCQAYFDKQLASSNNTNKKSNIEDVKRHYYLAIRSIHESYNYVEALDSNLFDKGAAAKYNNFISRINNYPNPHPYLKKLGLGLAIFGAIAFVGLVIVAPFIAPLAISISAIPLIESIASALSLASLFGGAVLFEKYRQHPWASKMSFFNKAVKYAPELHNRVREIELKPAASANKM